jgi:Bacteriophage probable baseplate hub protein
VVERTANNPADIMHAALVITRLLRKKINNRLTGSGTAVGDPRIRAGAVLRLDGLGPSFSGVYRVTSAIHTIDSGGYRTDFKVRRELIP